MSAPATTAGLGPIPGPSDSKLNLTYRGGELNYLSEKEGHTPDCVEHFSYLRQTPAALRNALHDMGVEDEGFGSDHASEDNCD